MADIFDKEKRRTIMRSVKSKNTQTEKIVFKYLRSEKIYFQKHYRKAPGSPDIALPRQKKAVFIDSDFWHGRDMSKVSHTKFWQAKILDNKNRDIKVNKILKDMGWSVLRIWESDLKRKSTSESTLRKVQDFLTT